MGVHVQKIASPLAGSDPRTHTHTNANWRLFHTIIRGNESFLPVKNISDFLAPTVAHSPGCLEAPAPLIIRDVTLSSPSEGNLFSSFPTGATIEIFPKKILIT